MLEYLLKKELPCVVTDRELRRELGISQGALSRLKVRLARAGKIAYVITSRHGGTEYQAVQSGAKKSVHYITSRHGGTEYQAVQSGAKKSVHYINTTIQERETRVGAREDSEPDSVLAAWAKYRGRVLIEDEKAEMASWRAQLGEKRLIELIAKAWRRCTADRMSFGYFADYFIAPELNGAKKAVQKARPAQVKPPIKAANAERSQSNGEKRLGKEIRDKTEPPRSTATGGHFRGARDLPTMSGAAVSDWQKSLW